jgi:hypothetical protein
MKRKCEWWSMPVVLGLTFGSLILSCSKSSDPITSEITQTVNNESTQDAQQDEVDDIAMGQLNVGDGAGRRTGAGDDRVACAYVTFSGDTTGGKAQGMITIDFDKDANGNASTTGCTDGRGNTRKGTITIAWSGGRWYKNGSTIDIEMINYSINGVVINGTRGLNNITTIALQPTWQIVSSVTSTWPDNTTATRTVTKTRLWDIVNGTVTMTQTTGQASAAAGTNRHGTTYTVQITTGLVYSETCAFTNKVYLPVSGTKIITIDINKMITVDFGSGTCDNTFTIMYDGKSQTLNAKNDSTSD